MLTPRYRTLSESISDFNRVMDGMDRVQPREPVRHEDLDELVRMEHQLYQMTRDIEHVERAIHESGFPLNEADAESLGKMNDQAADRLHTLANRAARKQQQATAGENPALAARFAEMHKRLRGKAQEYEKKTKKYTGKRNLVTSMDPAPMSQYKTESTAMQSFRVLAGLEERLMMPRDPGLLGATRLNEGYSQMAQPFDEGESPAHKGKMKATAAKLHALASRIDQEYAEDSEYHEGGGSRGTKATRQRAHMDRALTGYVAKNMHKGDMEPGKAKMAQRFSMPRGSDPLATKAADKQGREDGEPMPTVKGGLRIRKRQQGQFFPDLRKGRLPESLALEARTKDQQYRGLRRVYSKSGKSISMAAPSERELRARAGAEKGRGSDPAYAQTKADLRQTLQKKESLALESRPKGQRVSAKKANRYAAAFRMHSDPTLSKVSHADAKSMAKKAKDRENKLAPQFVRGMRLDAGSPKQSPDREARYRDRVRYDWQKKS